MIANKKRPNVRTKAPSAAPGSRRASARIESGSDSGPAERPAGPSTSAVAPETPAAAAAPTSAGIDAAVRAGVALADGVQAIGRAVIEMQRQSIAAGLAAARSLIDARNLDDVMAIQRRYVTGRVEQTIRESGNIAELARRVAGGAWTPLSTGADEAEKSPR